MTEYDANLWTLETIGWLVLVGWVIAFTVWALVTWSHNRFLERILDDLPIRNQETP